jgi:hypothetical protein
LLESWSSCGILLGDRIAGQFADQRCHASDSELDINAVRLDINPLDEEFNDARLFGWEEFIPRRLDASSELRTPQNDR